VNILVIVFLAAFIFVALKLYKRYYPVHNVPCADNWNEANKEDITVLDIRDYNENDVFHIPHAIRIPYAYLPRFYKGIPSRPIHVVVSHKLDRNLSLRFLLKKGFQIKSYSLMDCPCEN
jgi:rhodanese-related sulfurtransferase